MGRGGYGPERGDRTQATKAYTGEGGEDLGRGMGQGGKSDRLGEAHAAERLPSATKEVDSRANLLLVEPKPKDEQGLRKAVRQRRGVRLRSYDTSDGEEVGTYLRISRQFLEEVFSETWCFLVADCGQSFVMRAPPRPR